MKSVLEVSLIG